MSESAATPDDAPCAPGATPAYLGLGMIVASAWLGWSPARDLVAALSFYRGRLHSIYWFEHVDLIWFACPLAIGLFLVFGKARKLLLAATITCLSLGLERLIFLGAGLLLDSGWGWSGTSIPRVIPGGAALVGVIGSALTWLLLGAWAGRMDRDDRRRYVTQAVPKRAIRGALGRLSAFTCFLLGLTLMGNQGWLLFLEVLQRFPTLRQVVLKADPGIRVRPLTPQEKEEAAIMGKADSAFREGYRRQDAGEFRKAWDAYATALGLCVKLSKQHPKNEIYQHQVALASNNLAWFLVTWPDATKHAPQSALPLAKDAVSFDPAEGNYWNTLGVVYYRLGDLDAANDALQRSMKVRNGGDSFDWYFLALIEHRRHRPDSARNYYEKAVEWTDQHRVRNAELARFRAEAAGLLGIAIPPTPELAQGGQGPNPSANNSNPRPTIAPKGFGRHRPH